MVSLLGSLTIWKRTPLGVFEKSEFLKVGELQSQLAARIIQTVHASELVKAFV
jgi:hypothetical protein